MKLLTKQSKKERFVGENGFILYNPTPQQYESIKNLLENACEINENYDIVGDIDVSFLKYIYENLTNVSEEVRPMTLTEFEDALSKKIFIEKDSDNIEAFHEIKKLLEEIQKNVLYELEEKINKMKLDLLKMQSNSNEINKEDIVKILNQIDEDIGNNDNIISQLQSIIKVEDNI